MGTRKLNKRACTALLYRLQTLNTAETYTITGDHIKILTYGSDMPGYQAVIK